jgi:cardiolipin synthase (CMP-forming)
MFKRHIANFVTSLRIILLPVLIYFIFAGNLHGFFWLALFMMFTDIIDGTIARSLKQESRFGVLLDSYADIGFFPVYFAGTIVLFHLTEYMNMVVILLPHVIHIFGSVIFPYVFIHKVEFFHLRFGQLAAHVYVVFFIVSYVWHVYPILYYIYTGVIICAALEEMFIYVRDRKNLDQHVHSFLEKPHNTSDR